MAIWGCIADDFTGAADAASFLKKGGMNVRLFNGIPKEPIPEDEPVDAWVIALKTRTQEKEQAVEASLAALAFLSDNHVDHIYIKYCSTFDSTREGNIGPCADAVMEKMEQKYTILCPGLPINGRTVKDGVLYVNGIPLDQSPMKAHPLTPMWDSRIDCLMKAQSRYSCMVLTENDMEQGKTEEIITEFGKGKKHFYVIPDFQTMSDAERLVQQFGKLHLLTGGSGILERLAAAWTDGADYNQEALSDRVKGKALLLAGSCSEMTRRQIQNYREQGGMCLKVDPIQLYKGQITTDMIWNSIQEMENRDVLIYTSDEPEAVALCQSYGREKIAQFIENTLSTLAVKAVQAGFKRIITAGGETGGAVTRALGYHDFYIGGSIAPGVPVMIPTACTKIRLVLKSGNFGQEDFFQRALEQTGECV